MRRSHIPRIAQKKKPAADGLKTVEEKSKLSVPKPDLVVMMCSSDSSRSSPVTVSETAAGNYDMAKTKLGKTSRTQNNKAISSSVDSLTSSTSSQIVEYKCPVNPLPKRPRNSIQLLKPAAAITNSTQAKVRAYQRYSGIRKIRKCKEPEKQDSSVQKLCELEEELERAKDTIQNLKEESLSDRLQHKLLEDENAKLLLDVETCTQQMSNLKGFIGQQGFDSVTMEKLVKDEKQVQERRNLAAFEAKALKELIESYIKETNVITNSLKGQMFTAETGFSLT